MADAAAARREARRKRILENSHNRLQLIAGKCGDDLPKDSPISAAVIHEHSHDTLLSTDNSICDNKIPLNNGIVASELESLDLLTLSRDIAAGDSEIPADLASFTSPKDPMRVSLWEKLTANRYDVVLLSIVLQILYGMSLFTYGDSYFFLPLLIYVITKLIWFPSPGNSKFDSVLQLLNGVSSRRVQMMIYFTQCLSVVSRDICVFLFTTICIQSLLITLNGLIT